MMRRVCRGGVWTLVLVVSGATARAETVGVAASGLSFIPADVTIQEGDSVHWTGLAGGFHTVAEVDDGSAKTWNGGFHSPSGASEYTHQFDTAGVYYYICEPHVFSGMRGTVTVEAGPIPTVSEWGLAVMTLLVLAAGTIVLGRRVPVAVGAGRGRLIR